MTKLEHFKAWLRSYVHRSRQQSKDVDDVTYFDDDMSQLAWLAFQHAFTVRPTTDSRLNSAEFMKDNPATIVDRLNGIFPTADPPYKMSPLHYEAAREIERLRGQVEVLTEASTDALKLIRRTDEYAGARGGREGSFYVANLLRSALGMKPLPAD